MQHSLEADLKIEMRDVETLIPYASNPRDITPDAIDKVANSIREFGWRQPIVVDENNVIIVGHTRLLAAQKLKAKKVPVHTAVGMSPEQVRAYRLADNRTGNEVGWNQDLLTVELKALAEYEFDLSLTAFDMSEIGDLLGDVKVTDAKAEEIGTSDEEPVQCPHCRKFFKLSDEVGA